MLHSLQLGMQHRVRSNDKFCLLSGDIRAMHIAKLKKIKIEDYIPAAFRKTSAKSVFSQVKSGSSRPKWP